MTMTNKEEHNKYPSRHPDYRREYQREWRKEHIEKNRTSQRNWRRKQYQKNPEKYRKICREWRRKHSERTKELYQKYYLRLKVKVIEKLGGKCVRCGFSDPRTLQIDHVHGGGVKEIKMLKNRRNFLKKVLADKEGNYQMLCANCNAIKKVENKEIGRKYRT